MQKATFFFILSLVHLLFITNLHSQEIIERKFYKSGFGGTPVSENKAKYVQTTIKNPDGSITYEVRELKKDKVYHSKTFKGDEPYGEWITISGKKLNYGFDLVYSESKCDEPYSFNLMNGKFIPELVGLVEPKFTGSENNFNLYIQKNLRYPSKAAENDISGSVNMSFTINENGNVVDIRVLKGVDINLDKEAARVIKESPLWMPAKKDGMAIDVCVNMTINFVMN